MSVVFLPIAKTDLLNHACSLGPCTLSINPCPGGCHGFISGRTDSSVWVFMVNILYLVSIEDIEIGVM